MIFENKKILIVGDLMLDTYLIGDVNRISPEAPVPIVNIKNKINKLGGAANVALNIKKMGSEPIICSIIGNDENGEILKKILNENEIETSFIISSNDRRTTNKNRLIGNDFQICRFDNEIIDDLNYNDFNNLSRNLDLIIDRKNIDVILMQDYDKGVIDRNLIDNIIKLSETEKIPVIVDPKKRNFNFYKNIKLFKPNYKELKEGLNLDSNLDRDEILKIGSELLHKNGIEILFITLSGDGIYISYDYGKKSKIISGIKRKVFDVSGAGDTVISIISLLIKSNIPIEKIAEISNISGGIVCENIGINPIDKEKLLCELKLKNINL